MQQPLFRQTGRRIVAENARFEVCFDRLEGPDGNLVQDFLVLRPRIRNPDGIAGVCVLPEIDGRVGLMRTRRHHFAEPIWQAPAGFLDEGEEPAACALRELTEETGLQCRPGGLVPLGVMLPDAGIIDAKVALFLARCLAPAASPHTAPREIEPGAAELTLITTEELRALADHSAWMGSATTIAIHRYLGRAER